MLLSLITSLAATIFIHVIVNVFGSLLFIEKYMELLVVIDC